jgi:hypothetical protein
VQADQSEAFIEAINNFVWGDKPEKKVFFCKTTGI